GGRRPVPAGRVGEQEDRPDPADAVAGVPPVQPRAAPALGLELLEPPVGALPELVDRPELDRVRGARLGARRLVVALEAVVAEGALPHPPPPPPPGPVPGRAAPRDARG